ncbi:la-related protein 6C-like [Pyrus ussuriensis x Pyrus communis]|uniref:La-related protein 6C-like n=1 Tax=Pyrus ussuriensis x Pyrus communis TaxID=2448454 RepID=A0A5N5IDD4_9ROSA|nr:la-related protein 6C-like [Pyrus ussuriensis x Pyrus communis]
MAQVQPSREKTQEVLEMEVKENPRSPSFKFNAQAPEFVPRSHAPMPISGYFNPCFHFLRDTASPDWFYVEDQELHPYLISNNPNINPLSNRSKNTIPDDLQ